MACPTNKSMECPCTNTCGNHGKCCACVANHLRKGDYPACYKLRDAEKAKEQASEV